MKLRWFLSGTVRQATDMVKHVQKLLNAQRDVLSPQAAAAVGAAVRETQAAIAANADNAALVKQMGKLEEAAGKWIKPYPNAEWRENIEVFLVAIVVAMAIRTFFLQPFKIPTGSMEPTLFGIEAQDLRDQPDFKMPGPLERFWDVIYYGTIYHEIIATEDGEVVRIGPLEHVLRFFNKQTFWVQYRGQDGLVPFTIWCGPDGRADRFKNLMGLDEQYIRSPFSKGDPIIRFKETTGDHLFVDRVTYNFRRPRRGDIVVFKTQGIEGIHDQDQFYIKRLVGLPGESVSIGDDQHARINGQRLDASTPHFENVYGFDPNAPPHEGKFGQYNGHILQHRSDSLLQSPDNTIEVRPRHFAVFGDNTLNSLDSRYWGDFPEENVIGRSFFVYWPKSSRFGWNSIDW
jgi:signal peptidase I